MVRMMDLQRKVNKARRAQPLYSDVARIEGQQLSTMYPQPNHINHRWFSLRVWWFCPNGDV